MNDLLWALGLTGASMTIMWFTCMRHMRRGHCTVRPVKATAPATRRRNRP